ncbi:chloride channel protein [Rhodospirillum sp. A1_3_36]|uniref:chloride channel protein n=1 Tax=Rhodospirillum sp. A1_3_36 TaxID=3391666 RepID=UPI0039A6ED9D
MIEKARRRVPFGRLLRRRLRTPFRLRALVRRQEIIYTAVAAVIGLIAGLLVVGMRELLDLIALLVFGHGGAISGVDMLDPERTVLGPLLGGVLLGISTFLGNRWFRRIADPIEANAIGGGKVEIKGSLFITIQTILSSGFGASVGMEAAYTQASSAVASFLGQRLRLRREDLRQLVAAGAGGAIAAAFDAPLTGAFYAFELILAAYSVAALLPVLASSIAATAIARLLMETHGMDLHFAGEIPAHSYASIAVLAVLSAGIGIVIMRSVAATETLFRKVRVPGGLRPVIGGLGVGLIALLTPRVLSSGHGAMGVLFDQNLPLKALALIFLLKMVASILSIGSGFRGGLFFASLLLGVLLGKILGLLWMMAFGLDLPIVVLAVVGMCALATAVIGAPLAMCFLALETTASLPLALAVLFAALISTAIVRQVFGFSFSTWRFHLRGETIRSAADIGWERDLSVARMMRHSSSSLPDTTSVEEARRRFPLGATKAVPLTDQTGRYAGLCLTTDLHWEGLDPEESIGKIARLKTAWLTPERTLREAIAAFGRYEADTLPVLGVNQEILGIVNEQYCLRRYAEETNKRLYPGRV